MKIKFLLAAGSALAIAAATSVALAASNTAYVNQRGADNVATVSQTGSGNVLGSGYGIGAYDAYQNGNNNTLSLTQAGNGNGVGTASGHNYGSGHGSVPANKQVSGGIRNSGIDQIGNYNAATITQVDGTVYNDGNSIGTIKQKATTGATATTNVLTIVQDNGNGTPGSTHAYPNVVGNSDYAYNTIGDVYQNNTGSGALGDRNTLTIDQHTNHTYAYSRGNRLDVATQDGVGNSASVWQLGITNIVNYLQQTGIGGGAGSGNSAAITQTGGNNNWIGTSDQQGSLNRTTVSQTGSNNSIASVLQKGTSNASTVTQFGAGNLLTSLSQDNSGAGTSVGNRATLIFNGSDNGVGLFAGAAATVSLTVATVSQLGDENLIDYQVSTNSNLFAFNQIGSRNSITGTVSGGNTNQVAVSQVGNGNTTTFTQIGGANNLAVLQ